MCVMSAVHDYGNNDWNEQKKLWDEYVKQPITIYPKHQAPIFSLEELLKWKEALDVLIKAAQEFDRKTNQPDCQSEEKMKWTKEVNERIAQLQKEKQDGKQ